MAKPKPSEIGNLSTFVPKKLHEFQMQKAVTNEQYKFVGIKVHSYINCKLAEACNERSSKK